MLLNGSVIVQVVSENVHANSYFYEYNGMRGNAKFDRSERNLSGT